MRGSQEVVRINARSDNDIKGINKRLQDGWRILHIVSFEADSMLVIVLEAPREFGEAR